MQVWSSEVRWAGDFQREGRGGSMKGRGVSIYKCVNCLFTKKFSLLIAHIGSQNYINNKRMLILQTENE